MIPENIPKSRSEGRKAGHQGLCSGRTRSPLHVIHASDVWTAERGGVVQRFLRSIVDVASSLLTRNDEYARMAQGVSPYGDGRVANRIAHLLAESMVSDEARCVL